MEICSSHISVIAGQQPSILHVGDFCVCMFTGLFLQGSVMLTRPAALHGMQSCPCHVACDCCKVCCQLVVATSETTLFIEKAAVISASMHACAVVANWLLCLSTRCRKMDPLSSRATETCKAALDCFLAAWLRLRYNCSQLYADKFVHSNCSFCAWGWPILQYIQIWHMQLQLAVAVLHTLQTATQYNCTLRE